MTSSKPPHLPTDPPPWWPHNQPWPPAGRWRRPNRRFFRRLGCLAAIFILFLALILALLIGLVANALGVIQVQGSLGWAIPLGVGLFLLGFGALAWGGRRLRGMSAPFDELLAAADQVAGGDYTTRVNEGGPPEVRSLGRAFNSMAARLQDADTRRRSLLADVTHELRTPLTVIQGNVEGMLDGIYAADEARFKEILAETQVLARLVEDLRTLSLAESGALPLQREPVDLPVLAGEALAAFRPQADAAGVELALETGELPLRELDPERIRQVLNNLLSNALRYTSPGGSIRLRCTMQGEHALIEVQDSGQGISPADLPHVFERFYKTRDSGGLGLGLAIARELVEAHGGTISASSQPGRGTTMQIVI